VYPDSHVTTFVSEHFIPVRVHVKEQADEFQRLGERFGAHWTPTTLVIDPSGEERHRIEGFLPAHDFIGQLALGLAHSAFAREDYAQAERRFREIETRHEGSDAGAEAQYWSGVSRYKQTNDGADLTEIGRRFQERYSDTPWAKKASVWRTP
jgi:hypothetical protein